MDNYTDIELLKHKLQTDVQPIFGKFSEKIFEKIIEENLVYYNKEFKNHKYFNDFLIALINFANVANKIKTNHILNEDIGYCKILYGYEEELLLLKQDYLENLENKLIKLHDDFEEIKVGLKLWETLKSAASYCFKRTFGDIFEYESDKDILVSKDDIDLLNSKELNKTTEHLVGVFSYHSRLDFKDYIAYSQDVDSFMKNLKSIIDKTFEFKNNSLFLKGNEQVSLFTCKSEISEIKESYENLLNCFKLVQNHILELSSSIYKENLEKSKVLDKNSFSKIQYHFRNDVFETLIKILK